MNAPREAALYFGDADRPLFGWLHRPAPDVAQGLGLVICNPFGYEAICTHRALRRFAIAATAVGFPVLRFDYDGTGDSCGDDLEPDRVAAWVASVHRAIDALCSAASVSRVCLLGVRLGATLAALAAQGRNEVVGIAALAPVLQGRAYVRELRAFAAAQQSAHEQTADASLLEVGGFVLTPATQAQLMTLDLLALTQSPAQQWLLMQRDDLPGNDRFAQHLRSLGAAVETTIQPGYREMMVDPHSSIPPAALIDTTLSWLARCADALQLRPASASATHNTVNARARMPRAQGGGTAVDEMAVFVDAECRIFGVVAMPATAGAQALVRSPVAQKAIVLLNAGATHHIGPNRWYVSMARHWAAQGWVVLRMDISGLGDSLPHTDAAENVVYTEHARSDLSAALAYLRSEHAVTACYAVGLCSGAYHAFKAAVAGAELDGVVMINPLTFFWTEGMSLDARFHDARVVLDAARYQKSIWQPSSWLRLLRGEVAIRGVIQVVGRRLNASIVSAWRNVARRCGIALANDLAGELDLLARRRMPMSFIFAAGDPGLALLRMQGGAMVDRLIGRGQLRIKIIDGADHVFATLAARNELSEFLSLMLVGENTLTSLL